MTPRAGATPATTGGPTVRRRLTTTAAATALAAAALLGLAGPASADGPQQWDLTSCNDDGSYTWTGSDGGWMVTIYSGGGGSFFGTEEQLINHLVYYVQR